MSKVATCLWFDGKAEEASRFYVETVPNSSLDRVVLSPVDTPGAKTGEVLLTLFRLGDQSFMGLNGNSSFSFTPATSVMLELDGQAEVDRVWDTLLEGGQPMACGWLTDRYGLAWQVVPKALIQMIQDEDQTKARRVMETMMTMIKLEEAPLRAAYEAA